MIKYPAKIKLANTPTPIEHLSRLSKLLSGAEIYIKRDDLTGLEMSGNKIRKLEFVVADALKNGADTLITCGGIESNHCRATAAVCAKLGINAHLVLRGTPPKIPDGNFLLDKLFNASFRFITKEEYQNIEPIFDDEIEKLKKNGLKPYAFPSGASNEIGVWGYIKVMEEICKFKNVKFDYIVSATGSGGTLAGLILGNCFFDYKAQVYGVNVCDDAEYFINKVNSIFDKFEERYKIKLKRPALKINIIEGFVGKGYALNTQEELEDLKSIARLEGIVLDPTYTVKAFRGLIENVKNGLFKKNKKILFIHTGGLFGIYPNKNLFRWK